jgi:hypothetical protein
MMKKTHSDQRESYYLSFAEREYRTALESHNPDDRLAARASVQMAAFIAARKSALAQTLQNWIHFGPSSLADSSPLSSTLALCNAVCKFSVVDQLSEP